MNNNLKVSIIIPVYNVNFDLFTKCVDSCINQTHQNIEILIITNGIEQNSELYNKILSFEQTDKRIKIVYCQQKGVSNARNIGIQNSTGNYITFVDADDYIEHNFAEKLLEINGSDIVICSFYKESNLASEKHIITNKIILKNTDEYIQDLLNIQKCVGASWAKLFKSSFLKSNNIFFDTNLSLSEDNEFCLRFIYYNPQITYIPDILYHYNLSSSTSTVRKFNEQYVNNYELAFNKMQPLIDMNKHLINWNNFIAYHVLLICVNYCFNTNNKKSYIEKKKILLNILNKKIFKDSIKLVNLKDFSFTRKITLFCLKHNLIILVYFISLIRNKTR